MFDRKSQLPAGSVVAGILVCLLSGNVHSQPSTQPAQKTEQPPALTNDDTEDFETRKMTAPMELPYLPEFPRKTFLRGMVKPKTFNGPSYIMYFSVKESPREVLDWYQTSLGASRWKIRQKMSHMVDAAHPEGHKCIVTTQYTAPVYDEQTKKFRADTKLSIYFQTRWK